MNFISKIKANLPNTNPSLSNSKIQTGLSRANTMSISEPQKSKNSFFKSISTNFKFGVAGI